MVFFMIDLSTRRIEIACIAPDPNGTWMKQIARNLTDCFDGFLIGKRYLIHDRDPLYTSAFTNLLKCTGIRCIKLPPKSPNLNAYAERFVRSIKYECLNRMIFFGEKHLRFIVNEYVEHYHTERNHLGIGNRLIERNDNSERCNGVVESHARLGGMLNFISMQHRGNTHDIRKKDLYHQSINSNCPTETALRRLGQFHGRRWAISKPKMYAKAPQYFSCR